MRRTDTPLVSILVLNWNGEAVLPECIESLRGTRYAPIEIVVVDNASTDGSPALLDRASDVRLIRNGTNLGYAAGNNAGIAHVRGKYTVTLNNDMIVDPDWLDGPIAALEDDERLGAVSCRQMNYFERDRIDTLYHVPTSHLVFERVGHGQRYSIDNPLHVTRGYVIGANGGSAVYRTSMLRNLGGFDERFFAYHDETDLCMRAFLAGWRCLYEPSSVVWHRDGHSFRKRAHAGFYFSERNRIWFIYKYFPPTLFLSGLPSLLLWELRMIKTIAITSRTPATYLRARRDGLGGIGMFRHERKRNIRALGNRLPLYRRILNHKIIGLPDPVS